MSLISYFCRLGDKDRKRRGWKTDKRRKGYGGSSEQNSVRSVYQGLQDSAHPYSSRHDDYQHVHSGDYLLQLFRLTE